MGDKGEKYNYENREGARTAEDIKAKASQASSSAEIFGFSVRTSFSIFLVSFSQLMRFAHQYREERQTSSDPLPDILDVIDNRLEVAGRIVTLRNEDAIFLARRRGREKRSDRDKPVPILCKLTFAVKGRMLSSHTFQESDREAADRARSPVQVWRFQ